MIQQQASKRCLGKLVAQANPASQFLIALAAEIWWGWRGRGEEGIRPAKEKILCGTCLRSFSMEYFNTQIQLNLSFGRVNSGTAKRLWLHWYLRKTGNISRCKISPLSSFSGAIKESQMWEGLLFICYRNTLPPALQPNEYRQSSVKSPHLEQTGQNVLQRLSTSWKIS